MFKYSSLCTECLMHAPDLHECAKCTLQLCSNQCREIHSYRTCCSWVRPKMLGQLDTTLPSYHVSLKLYRESEFPVCVICCMEDDKLYSVRGGLICDACYAYYILKENADKVEEVFVDVEKYNGKVITTSLVELAIEDYINRELFGTEKWLPNLEVDDEFEKLPYREKPKRIEKRKDNVLEIDNE